MNTKQIFTLATLALTALSTTSCRSTLYYAARDGDVQTVRAELANNADPTGKASNWHLLWQVPTSLVTIPVDAIRKLGPLTIIVPLIDPGWKLVTNEQGTSEFQFDNSTFLTKKVYEFGNDAAIETTKNADIITELLIAGAQGSTSDKIMATREAACRGDAITLQKLLKNGCKPTQYFKNDYTPLMLAVGNGHETCARLLISYGAQLSSYVIIQGKAITCYDYAESRGQLYLYYKLGGNLTTAPSILQGKKIYFDFSSAKATSFNQWWQPTAKTTWNKSNHPSWGTSPFNKNNKCEADLKYTCMRNYEYEKTGASTATLSTTKDSDITECYYLNFTTGNSGTASMISKKRDGGIAQENIKFDIL